MRKLALLIVAVALVGCRTPASAFKGVFSGTLTYVCSETGTGLGLLGRSFNYNETWIIVERNKALNITTGTCDPFTAAVSGNVATIQRQTCPRVNLGSIAS